jgi:16S rRNA (uracil1498-N3)-methyltransferase
VEGPHFFVEPGDVVGDEAVLRGDEAHHLTGPLRASPGDAISLADGAGTVYQGRVEAVGDKVTFRLESEAFVARPRPSLTVVHALPKARKLDGVVRGLTELGIDRLVPVHTARSELRLTAAKAAKAVARWRAVALSAAKQARRAYLPEIAEVGSWAGAFEGGGRSDADGVVLWEEASTGLQSVLVETEPPEELVLGIGPEGGLTTDEVERTGLPAASLGPTVLRTETAGLVAASVAFTVLGRLG